MKRLAAFFSLMLLISCNKNYDYVGMFYSLGESADERFEMSMAYNDTHGYDKIHVDSDDYSLYVMTDVHVDFSTVNLDRYVSDYLNDSLAPPFSLCLGDVINATGHFDYFFEHVLPVTDAGRKIYYCAGNHDVYFKQWKECLSHIKTSTYWFEVVTPSGFRDLYVALDSSSGTLGVKQREWLENLLAQKSKEDFRNIIVFTHTHFFKKDSSQGHTSNFNLEETYDLADLFARYGVDLVLQGHSHSRDITVFKGVTYLRLDAIEDHYPNAFYTIITVGDEFRYDFIKVG